MDIGEHIAVNFRLVMCTKPVMLWVSFACLALVSADSNGGSHQEKHHGDHHGSDYFYRHCRENYEEHHSETEQHEVCDDRHDVHTVNTKGPIKNAIHKLEQQFLLQSITGRNKRCHPLYHSKYFSGLIDPSVEATIASCKQSSLQKQSYGDTVIWAGLGDTLTSYLEGNHWHTGVLSISKDLFKDV